MGRRGLRSGHPVRGSHSSPVFSLHQESFRESKEVGNCLTQQKYRVLYFATNIIVLWKIPFALTEYGKCVCVSIAMIT